MGAERKAAEVSRTFADQWEEYLAQVIPKSLGPWQIKALRATFYAGAAAFWGTMQRAVRGAAGDPEAVARLDQELRDYLDAKSEEFGAKKGEDLAGQAEKVL